jgi:photosystem II stability/assembly factor-like uncharacterized protein
MKKRIAILVLAVLFALPVNAQIYYYQWNPVFSPVTYTLNSIASYMSTNILVIPGNNGTLLFSSNNGTNWITTNTGTTADLYSTYFSATTLLTGAAGTILKSTNNGLNWSISNSPTTANINSTANFLSPNYKVICTDGGKIYISTNIGSNWSEIASGTGNNLRYIFYHSGTFRNYICGDNGTFLKMVYTLPTPLVVNIIPMNTGVNNHFYCVRPVSTDTLNLIMVGSGGMILRTSNGGVNWYQQASGTSNSIRSVISFSSSDLWVAGDNGTILHTTNGGYNWIPQVVNSGANVNSITSALPTKFIAAGSGGTILECNFPNYSDTTVSFSTISKNNISSYFTTTGIFNNNPNTINTPGFEWPKGTNKYAVYSSGLSIAGMVNGNLRQAMCSYKGEFWQGQIIGGVAQIKPGMSKVWKVTAGDNCTNSIDWANWGMIVPYGAPYRDMNNNGVYDACTDIPGMRNATQTLFMILTDGFASKHSVGEGFGGGTLPLNADMKITVYTYGDSILNDVQFVKFDIINRGPNAWNNLYFSLIGDADLGDSEDDYLCMDSTRNMWIDYNSDNYDPIYGLAPPAVGMRVLKFPVNKTVIPFDTIKSTSGVQFICTGCPSAPCENTPNGEPLGAYNMIKGYKKDGSKWMNPTFTPPRPVKFIYGGEPEPNTGWTEVKGSIWNCGGDTGTYHPTNPGGDRRYVLSMGKENFTMNPGDSQTIVIAQMIARGANNLNSVTILKQLSDLVANYTVGIKQVSTEIPANYSLGLNYPNPFNNTSNLKFEIANLEDVKLVVYDIMGREVQTIVNERLQPGSYEVTFDGSGLNSGVYFYQLIAGSYRETRRLVFIK